MPVSRAGGAARAVLVTVLLLAVGWPPGGADVAGQVPTDTRRDRTGHGLAGSGSLVVRQQDAGDGAAHPRAAGAALRSLVLPGWGQRVLGRRTRMWLFAGVEAASWLAYGERRIAGSRARDRYRDFAWERARLHLAPRREADFEYYETLTKWPRSGAFDADPSAPGVQPERDPLTYNGAIWARALALFLGSDTAAAEGTPGYEAARAYYVQHAYGDPFLWDWRGDPEGPSRLRALIAESDARFRQATTALGIVLANHVIAAVDAYLTGARSGPPSLRLTPRPTPFGMGVTFMMHLSTGG